MHLYSLLVPLYLCLSDGFVFLYCRGWTYGNGVRNPNSILGVLVRENFPGLIQLPGPDQVPQPGLFWEHYCAASAPSDTIINGFECHQSRHGVQWLLGNFLFTQ